MTCIVGYIDRQKRTIYMGGDSAGGIVERINQALQCAAYYSAGVRRPFKIIKMEY